MKRIFTPLHLVFFLLVFLLISFLLSKCKSDPELVDLSWVLSAEDQKVSILDYKEAYEIAQLPYTSHMMRNPELRRVLHQRILNDFKENLVVRAAARREGIFVTPKEIDKGVEEIRSAYTEEDFQAMIAENAFSEEVWERSIRRRLVVQKITEKVLERDVDISVEALKKAYLDYCRVLGKNPADVPYTEELADQMILRLRMQDAGRVYEAWLRKNQEQIQVQINFPLLHEVFPSTRALAVRGNGEIYNTEAAEAKPQE